MSSPPEKAAANQGTPFTVSVELVSWVTTFVGGSGSGSMTFQQPATTGDTVGDVLRALSKQHTKLHESLWDADDRSQIGGHIEIIVNEAILGIAHQLDSPIKPGDRIMLTGQYVGG